MPVVFELVSLLFTSILSLDAFSIKGIHSTVKYYEYPLAHFFEHEGGFRRVSLGKRIREIRLKRGLTQEYIAKKLGMGRSNVGHIENGRTMPSAEVLDKIAQILDVSADYLLGRTDTPLRVNERIFALRRMKQLTTRQMADELGVDEETYVAWETGAATPSHYDLEKIAKYHKIDVNILYGLPPSHLSSDAYADGYTEEEVLEEMEHLFRANIGYQDKNRIPKNNEERDIARELERIMESLDSDAALAFDGEPLDEQDKELLRVSLENSIRLARQLAKQKFTPKKYRKD